MHRESNFELLKVVSIMMVITLHYLGGMGGGLTNVIPGTLNYYVMRYLEMMSIVAVNCFILVSGYFMIGKNQIKLKKALSLIMITIFYGLLFYTLKSLRDGNFNLTGFLNAAIPFNGSNWFVGSYTILYLLSPFINIVLKQITKKQYQQLLIICICSFSILPTLLPGLTYNDHGYGLLSFILLYTIGVYIKLHYTYSINRWFYICAYLIFTTISFKFFNLDYNFLTTILSSVSLFLFFSMLSFSSKIINYLATFTFAIYIIHTNPSLINYLFMQFLKCNRFWNSHLLLIHLGLSILFIFGASMFTEIVRRYLANKLLGKFKFNAIESITIGTKKSA